MPNKKPNGDDYFLPSNTARPRGVIFGRFSPSQSSTLVGSSQRFNNDVDSDPNVDSDSNLISSQAGGADDRQSTRIAQTGMAAASGISSQSFNYNLRLRNIMDPCNSLSLSQGGGSNDQQSTGMAQSDMAIPGNNPQSFNYNADFNGNLDSYNNLLRSQAGGSNDQQSTGMAQSDMAIPGNHPQSFNYNADFNGNLDSYNNLLHSQGGCIDDWQRFAMAWRTTALPGMSSQSFNNDMRVPQCAGVGQRVMAASYINSQSLVNDWMNNNVDDPYSNICPQASGRADGGRSAGGVQRANEAFFYQNNSLRSLQSHMVGPRTHNLLPHDPNIFSTEARSCDSGASHDVVALMERMGLGNEDSFEHQSTTLYCELREVLLVKPIEHVVAMKQEESVQLRKLLIEGNAQIRKNIALGLCVSIHEIMKNQYAHQVFEDLLDYCNDEEIEFIVYAAAKGVQLVKDARNSYGFSSLKKLIAKIKNHPQLLERVTSALAPKMNELLTNTNGRLFVQHCLEHLTYQQNIFLFKAVMKACVSLAGHEKGYEALREFISKPSPCREPVMHILATNTMDLSMSYYGNYVIQDILLLGYPNINKVIVAILKSNFLSLSMNRSGSFVLERCLESSSGEELGQTILEMGAEDVAQMARDQFANYVLQKAVKMARTKRWGYHNLLVDTMKKLPESLMCDPHANKLYRLVQ